MSLSDAQKAIVSGLFLLGAIAALAIPGYDVSFTDLVVALVGPVFGVIAVFTAPTFSPETFEKTLNQLWAAVSGVIGYFVVIPASTSMKVVVLIGAIVSVAAVAYVKNKQYTYTIDKLSR